MANHVQSLAKFRTAMLMLLPVLYVAFLVFEASNLQVESIELDQKVNNVVLLNRLRAAAPPQREEPPEEAVLRGRRTMVLLANFRDTKRCGETLKTMFEHAVAPDLLRVSIHDQIYESKGERPCVEEYCRLAGEATCRRTQIVSSRVDAADAKGPTIARYLIEQHIADEEFCLGIDSHLVFVPRWDEKVVQQWEDTGNENAILTVYPKDTMYLEDRSKDDEMGYMCHARIETPEADAMVQFLAVAWKKKNKTTKPMLHAQFAGGFNFGSCRNYKDVPNDPYTPILFYGEEYHRAARLWTSGYDFYSPSVDVVHHWFEDRGKIWDEDWAEKYKVLMRSKRRVRASLGLPVSSDDYDHTDIEKYGLGKKRTFEQWLKFSRIDPLAKHIEGAYDQFNMCKEGHEYVPFEK